MVFSRSRRLIVTRKLRSLGVLFFESPVQKNGDETGAGAGKAGTDEAIKDNFEPIIRSDFTVEKNTNGHTDDHAYSRADKSGAVFIVTRHFRLLCFS